MNIGSIIFLTGSLFVYTIDANCDPGYTLAGTFCYKFDGSRKGNFDTQKRRCEEDGSHLIEYPNYQSFDDLSAYVRSLYGRSLPYFWIGLKGMGGSDLKNAKNFHWLSDLFGPNTKVDPGLLTWWRNYPYPRNTWLCVFTEKGVLVNYPCTKTYPILACQYDPLIGRNYAQQQNLKARDDRYYQAAPLPSSYASKIRGSNLASERRARLNALRDQRNSGQMVGYGNGGYGSSSNANSANGYGMDSNNRFGSSQNQNSGGQNQNSGGQNQNSGGQYRNGGNGQYGNGINGQNANGENGQYGTGDNGQSGNGGNGQYGNGGNGQYENGQNGNGGNGQYGTRDNGQSGNEGSNGASNDGGAVTSSAGSGTNNEFNRSNRNEESDAECS